MADRYAPARPETSASMSKTNDQAIYHEVSPTVTLLVRILNFVVLLLIAVAFVLSLVQGKNNKAYYLLACNIVISTNVGLVVNYWYRKGDLGADKSWYIVLIGIVIAVQCITTDVFIFHVPPAEVITTTTVMPTTQNNTVIPSTITAMTIRTTSTLPHGWS